MIVIGVVGLLGTFGAMVATGGPGRIGTIWFVPWVALLASQLGPAGGAASGVAAAVLYFVGAEVLTDSDDPVALVLNSSRSSRSELPPATRRVASRPIRARSKRRLRCSGHSSIRRWTASASPTCPGGFSSRMPHCRRSRSSSACRRMGP